MGQTQLKEPLTSRESGYENSSTIGASHDSTNDPLYGSPLEAPARSTRPAPPHRQLYSTPPSKPKPLFPVIFRWDHGGRNVSVSGSFNDWQEKIPLRASREDFTTIVELPEGQHQYKYFIDGRWIHDPGEAMVSDNFGGLNNIMEVKRSDYDFNEAIDVDIEASGAASTAALSSSPPGEYSTLLPEESLVTSPLRSPSPPTLPPQLLHALLNLDPISEEDPSLMAIPSHVMLNHLYALSVRDGVMVLGSTHRYRQKYITTMLYKPISS